MGIAGSKQLTYSQIFECERNDYFYHIIIRIYEPRFSITRQSSSFCRFHRACAGIRRGRFLANFIHRRALHPGCWGWTDTVSGRNTVARNPPVPRWSRSPMWVIRGARFRPQAVVVGGSNAPRLRGERGQRHAVIDLSYLPDSVHLVRAFIPGRQEHRQGPPSTRGTGFSSTAARSGAGGVLIFDLADLKTRSPANTPVVTHDCFVGTYDLRRDQRLRSILSTRRTSTPAISVYDRYSGAGTHNAATTATDGTRDHRRDRPTPKTLKFWDLSPPSSDGGGIRRSPRSSTTSS